MIIIKNIWKFIRDEPNNNITDAESFKSKLKFLNNTNGQSIINTKITVPLKYLNNFSRTLEMPLINCEINLILTWSANCVIYENKGETIFAMKIQNFMFLL